MRDTLTLVTKPKTTCGDLTGKVLTVTIFLLL